ncbi:MAG: inorganic phosphate transporter [Alphaproteobacteria bacterium]
MSLTILVFLSSGLFLGWSLGANDASNVFGTAVGTRMVKFSTAAIVCSIFVIWGATVGGAGAAHTLGQLGSVNAIAGSFMVALAAAITVYWMTTLGIPVSTTQAIVGAIIGWNLFSGSITDLSALIKIFGTWVACPLLAALIAMPIYKLVKIILSISKLHLVRLDALTRIGLILGGAFGSYALGANNISNVMGVFVPVSPFTNFKIFDTFQVTGVQQLFFVGALAIAVGVFTYSKRVMVTVGGGLMPLSPIGAWVVVVAQSVVLLLFASEGLEHWLAVRNLPTIPLVPVSSSQAVVGAVIGIGLLKGGKGISWRVLGRISSGWVTTPVISASICFVSLFFLQNVFNQAVYNKVYYNINAPVLAKLETDGIKKAQLKNAVNKKFDNAVEFRKKLISFNTMDRDQVAKVIERSEIYPIYIDEKKLKLTDFSWFNEDDIATLYQLSGSTFEHKWQLKDALSALSESWKPLPNIKKNKLANKSINQKLSYVIRTFHVKD